jgi:hypothetical protein
VGLVGDGNVDHQEVEEVMGLLHYIVDMNLDNVQLNDP